MLFAPSAPAAVATQPAGDVRLLSGTVDGPLLDPRAAFVPTVEFVDPDTLLVRWRIAAGYYLYRNRLQFALEGPHGTSLGPVRLPPGQPRDDPHFGAVRVFYHNVEAVIPVKRSSPGALRVILVLGYQGCAAERLCYQPLTARVPLVLPPAPRAPSASAR